MTDLLPSVLAKLPYDFPYISLDTETSGLYRDDGARVSTVSLAWLADYDADDFHAWVQLAKEYDNLTLVREEYVDGQFAWIASIAWPFDQGVTGTGKPEDHGQGGLWNDADNLPVEEWDALCSWLVAVSAGQDPNLIMHNAKFDIDKMDIGVRRWPGRGVNLLHHVLWDTQIGNDMIWPLYRTSLKPTAARLFGEEREDESLKVKAYLKKQKLPTGRWDLIPWDIVGPYADLDARLTLMLFLRQRWEIEQNGACKWMIGKRPDGSEPTGDMYDVLAFFDRRMRTMQLLTKMEWRGLPYHEVESRLAAIECRNRAKPLVDQLPFSPPTLPAAKEYYFGSGTTAKGVPCLELVPYSTTEAGAPQMTEEIVTRMVADDMPFAKTWAEYQKVLNAASMWYDGYADKMGPDGRLRTVFRQNGTVSTRFSVERVNLQAIPQDYRLSSHSILEGVLTPRQLIALAVTQGLPGWKLWELDLAQAELRVAAMYAKCIKMLRMIESGEDLHTYTTLALFGKGLPGGVDDPNFGQFRQVGKRGNFSLIFGSGPGTFQKMVSKETGIRLTDGDSFRIVRDWNNLYPEFGRAIDRHMNRVVQRQNSYNRAWIDLANGERRWFRGDEDAHKAFNQRVQPNLAQFGIDWMLETEEIMLDSGVQALADDAGIGGAGLLLTIHDSQVLLLPDNEFGDALADEAQNAGRRIWASRFDVPGDVDKKVWSKAA